MTGARERAGLLAGASAGPWLTMAGIALAVLAAGCQSGYDMRDQPRYKALAAAQIETRSLLAFLGHVPRHMTKIFYQRRNLSRLFFKLERHRDLIDRCETLRCDDADVVIVAIGISARAARRAVELCRAQGLRVGLFRPITLWPFPEMQLREAAAKARAVLVPEMNTGQLRLEVERVLGGMPVEGIHLFSGEAITPADIAAQAAALARGT